MFFDSWTDLLRVTVVALVAYPALIALLRLSGKRTLAKMNAFDLVVTVALGSTLATILLNRDVSLSEGVLALAMLILLQFVSALASVRSRRVRRLLKSEPALLLRDGRFLTDAMERHRVPSDEVRQAIRSQGIGAVEDVAAVVLETDGTFSVIPRSSAGAGTSFAPVRGADSTPTTGDDPRAP
ncbi:DUF421 domain-containing protein [Streptomyces calidiresistens]|uniref:DUF421 domain-containing protein n=1 Tax=Streptomyces calidiresistens TaxID=1485586 RepID=A0A7W3XVC6_9ACTN|nr:YetF domain-containing protein [Streptomyces calidiresistens]MBB0228577.1 DUF421 domain-containing protein [Streptomyces calidiresistens]